jgi:hypothetical protein
MEEVKQMLLERPKKLEDKTPKINETDGMIKDPSMLLDVYH